MVLKVVYFVLVYVVLLYVTQVECIPIQTISQESVSSQTQPAATTELAEERKNQESLNGERNIGREAVERIDSEMKRRLGIPSLTDIRSNHHGISYISDYIQNLYEQMLQLYDFNQSKQTSGVTRTTQKIAIPSVHIYRPISGDEENYHFFLNLSRHASSNITSSQLILTNVTTSTNITITFTAAGNHTGKQLELRSDGNTAVADILHIIQNLENVSLRILSTTHASYNPVIALFVNVNPQDLAAYAQRSKRDVGNFHESLNQYGTNINRSEATVNTAESLNICRVKPWVLNFTDIGWGNVIRIPKAYRADMCVGRCPAVFIESYLNTTNFAFIKNLYHVKTNFIHKDEVPVACCTPTLFTSRTVLYQENSELILKAIPEMRVVACGCR